MFHVQSSIELLCAINHFFHSFISGEYGSSSYHRVEVKEVKTAKKVKNPYFRNVKLRVGLAILLQFCKPYSHEVCVYHGVFVYGGSNGVTAIFVTWLEWPRVTQCLRICDYANHLLSYMHDTQRVKSLVRRLTCGMFTLLILFHTKFHLVTKLIFH